MLCHLPYSIEFPKHTCHTYEPMRLSCNANFIVGHRNLFAIFFDRVCLRYELLNLGRNAYLAPRPRPPETWAWQGWLFAFLLCSRFGHRFTVYLLQSHLLLWPKTTHAQNCTVSDSALSTGYWAVLPWPHPPSWNNQVLHDWNLLIWSYFLHR